MKEKRMKNEVRVRGRDRPTRSFKSPFTTKYWSTREILQRCQNSYLVNSTQTKLGRVNLLRKVGNVVRHCRDRSVGLVDDRPPTGPRLLRWPPEFQARSWRWNAQRSFPSLRLRHWALGRTACSWKNNFCVQLASRNALPVCEYSALVGSYVVLTGEELPMIQMGEIPLSSGWKGPGRESSIIKSEAPLTFETSLSTRWQGIKF